jgi:DNA mismatch endonuclease (patch repair protein)
LVVDVRGCFWHRCPLHGSSPKANSDWWTEKLARNTARDAETEALLRAAGWRLVVVWEHEDPVAAADRVAAELVMEPGFG